MLTYNTLINAKKLLNKDPKEFRRLLIICGFGFMVVSIGILYYFYYHLPRTTMSITIYPNPVNHRRIVSSFVSIYLNYTFWMVICNLGVRWNLKR